MRVSQIIESFPPEFDLTPRTLIGEEDRCTLIAALVTYVYNGVEGTFDSRKTNAESALRSLGLSGAAAQIGTRREPPSKVLEGDARLIEDIRNA